MKQEDMERWIRKFYGPVVELNRLFREYALENNEPPQVYIFKDKPKEVGENVLTLDVSIIRNPSFSDWEELHIDFCRTFPRASVFSKVWYPTQCICKWILQEWWHEHIYAPFWNSEFRKRLRLKHWSDGDC